MYEYKAKVIRVVDGDTVDLEVDMGFDHFARMKFRLAGINAPELKTSEGREAKAYLESVLPEGKHVFVRSSKDRKEKYGRYLAYIYDNHLTATKSYNDMLVESGHAVPYMV